MAQTIRRLHWGCGDVRPAGWINSDMQAGPGIDITSDIQAGLPLKEGSIDYITSQHALQQLKVYDILAALIELHRILSSGGVLRLCLPDFDKAIAAYQAREQDYLWCWDWDTLGGNFLTQLIDFGYTRTLLNFEFTQELLLRAGFSRIEQTAYRQTVSPYPEIVELDSRPAESFYVEAFK